MTPEEFTYLYPGDVVTVQTPGGPLVRGLVAEVMPGYGADGSLDQYVVDIDFSCNLMGDLEKYKTFSGRNIELLSKYSRTRMVLWCISKSRVNYSYTAHGNQHFDDSDFSSDMFYSPMPGPIWWTGTSRRDVEIKLSDMAVETKWNGAKHG